MMFDLVWYEWTFIALGYLTATFGFHYLHQLYLHRWLTEPERFARFTRDVAHLVLEYEVMDMDDPRFGDRLDIILTLEGEELGVQMQLHPDWEPEGDETDAS